MNQVERRASRHTGKAIGAIAAVMLLAAGFVAHTTWTGTPDTPSAAGSGTTSLATMSNGDPLPPLVLSGDDALRSRAADEGWPGAGTDDDPIRIEGLQVGGAGPVIELTDTTLRVVIQRNRITSDSMGEAIRLQDSHNVTLLYNHITGPRVGIAMVGGGEHVVRHNTFSLTGTATDIRTAIDVRIEDNHIGASGTGIQIDHDARDIVIRNNTFEAVGTGVHADGTRVHVLGNAFSATTGTAVVAGGSHHVIEGNRFAQGIGDTLHLSDVEDSSVRDNRFLDGQAAAIRTDRTDSVVITHNTFGPHARGGVRGHSDHRLNITENVFEDNGRAAVIRDGHAVHIVDNTVTGTMQGFDLSHVQTARVAGNQITGATLSAINLFGGGDIDVHGNRVGSAQVWGIYATGTVGSTIRDNHIIATPFGIGVFDGSTDVRVAGNRLDGPGTTGIAVANTTRVAVAANELFHHANAILVGAHADRTTVAGGLLRQNNWGIILDKGSLRTTLDAVQVMQSTVGVFLSGTHSNTVHDMDIKANGQGLLLLESRDNTIAHNRLHINRLGVHYVNSTRNVFFDNLVSNQHLPGDQNLLMEDSPLNVWNVTRRPGTNIVGGAWVGGNVWHDYAGPDADQDGIGDVPHGPIPYTPLLEDVRTVAPLPMGPFDMHPLIDTEHQVRPGSTPLPLPVLPLAGRGSAPAPASPL